MAVPSVRHDPGTHSTLSGLKIGKKISLTDFPDYAKFLGCEVVGPRGHTYRFVCAGENVAAPEFMTFAYSALASNAKQTFTVARALRGGTKPLNRPCGVAVEDQEALAVGDGFWLHVDGPEMAVFLGDADVDVEVGDYVDIDDDADTGKVYGKSTTFAAEFTMGVALDAEAGTDAVIRIRPIKKLQG